MTRNKIYEDYLKFQLNSNITNCLALLKSKKGILHVDYAGSNIYAETKRRVYLISISTYEFILKSCKKVNFKGWDYPNLKCKKETFNRIEGLLKKLNKIK